MIATLGVTRSTGMTAALVVTESTTGMIVALGVIESPTGMIVPPGMTAEGTTVMTKNRPVKKDCSA
jgi:hypothetical protein